MTRCQTCRAPAQAYLCERHIEALDQMCEQLDWLEDELEVTRCRMDRLTVGNTRRSANTLSPIHAGAMEAARDLAKVLAWLAGRSAREIASRKDAGNLFAAVMELAGDPDRPDSFPGRLLQIVNRPERVFAGLCATLVGRNTNGEGIECGTTLWALYGALKVLCPKCEYETDVARSRARGLTDGDLMPEQRLLDALAKMGEPLGRTKLHELIAEGRVSPAGWLHSGVIVRRKIRYHDQRCFSISALRATLSTSDA